MSEANNIGSKELLLWRMMKAIASSVVVQFFLVSCVILVTNLSVIHPLAWLGTAWTIIARPRTWSYFLVLACVVFLQGAICSKRYLYAPPYLRSRFAALCDTFAPHNLLVGALHAVIGAVLAWLHLSIEGGRYGALTVECDSLRGSCFVEEHFFLLLGGFWSGLYFYAKTNLFGLRHLQFPIVPRSKFARVKGGVAAALPNAVFGTIWPTVYFAAVYFLLGSYFRETALTVLFIPPAEEPLDGLARLLDLRLALHAWLYAAFFVLTTNSMHLLFQAYLTEWVAFDVVRSAGESSGVTLPEALAADRIPIMRHLGYLDLVTLAQKDRPRRAVLFTLSQPGGHPYHWNAVVEKCLAHVASFTRELDDACRCVGQTRRAAPPASAASARPYERTHPYNMRSLTTQPQPPPPPYAAPENARCPANEQLLAQLFERKKRSFIDYLLAKPPIDYLFGEHAENRIRHVLLDGQTVIWAADAVSSLAVASLREDPYGVAQKDVPAIVETLLALKRALDRLQKTSIAAAAAKKPQSYERRHRQIVASLRSAAKRSVYRITLAFREYIGDIALDASTVEQLQGFLNCRE